MPANEQQYDEQYKTELNKKDGLKKEEAAESMKTRCKICFKEIFPNPKCSGHGGKSGGSGKNAGKGDGQIPANIPGQIIDTVAQAANATTLAMGARNLSQQAQLAFNPKVISELLSKKLLLIDNNRDSGILTIKLRCNFSALSEEQRNELNKFADAILKALDMFKKEKNISSNCVTIGKDNEGNFLSLQITLPTPTAYDAFIQRLVDENLLPMQNVKQTEKVVYQEGTNHFNPTPLSMKPTPTMNNNVRSANEEKHQAEKQGASKKDGKSSFIRPRSPLDGLKPQGWK